MGLAANSTNVATPKVPPRINTGMAMLIDTLIMVMDDNPIMIFFFLSNLILCLLFLFFCLACKTRTIAKTYTIGKGPIKKSKKIETTTIVPKVNDVVIIRIKKNKTKTVPVAIIIFFLLSNLILFRLSNSL